MLLANFLKNRPVVLCLVGDAKGRVARKKGVAVSACGRWGVFVGVDEPNLQDVHSAGCSEQTDGDACFCDG